ncbi:MAG: hypothetical protein ACLU8J_11785 [Acutalibacter sp.]
MACYLAMGWVVAAWDFYRAATPLCFWSSLAGGILYTPNVLYRTGKKVPYMHAVFHLFVLGAACSTISVGHPAMREKKGKASMPALRAFLAVGAAAAR